MDSAAPLPVVRLGLLSGLLLWAAFFPFNIGPLAFIALVPFVPLAVEPMPRRRRLLGVGVFGMTFFVLALKWIRVAHPMMFLSWIGLAMYCTLVIIASVYAMRMLMRRGVAWWLALPACWIAGEYFRCHFPTGFPALGEWYHPIGFGWYFVGHTQHDAEWIRLSAAWGGVYAISLLVLCVNCAVAAQLGRLDIVRRWACLDLLTNVRRIRPAILASSLAIVFALYYAVTPVLPVVDRVTLSLIQTNIPQDVKNDRSAQMREDVVRLGRDGLGGLAIPVDQKPAI